MNQKRRRGVIEEIEDVSGQIVDVTMPVPGRDMRTLLNGVPFF